MSDLAWQDRAACANEPPDLFFPGAGDTHNPAKAICARCPVRAECLEYALANNIGHGIWGGASERERQRMRRQRRRAA